jgi:hypothetical protein
MDIYGPWGNPHFNNNRYVSLMGVTVWPSPSLSFAMHMDGYHKMLLGWSEPEILEIGDEPHCRLIGPAADGGNALILSFEERRGREFYLLEHRSQWGDRSQGTYDERISQPGLVTYYIHQDEPGLPSTRLSYIGPNELWGTLHTRPKEDDALVRAGTAIPAILAGPNNIVDSTPRKTDIGHNELTVLAVPPIITIRTPEPDGSIPLGAIPGRFGEGGVWDSVHGDHYLEWPGKVRTGVRVRSRRIRIDGKFRLAVAVSDRNGNYPHPSSLLPGSLGILPGEVGCFQAALDETGVLRAPERPAPAPQGPAWSEAGMEPIVPQEPCVID